MITLSRERKKCLKSTGTLETQRIAKSSQTMMSRLKFKELGIGAILLST